MGADLSILELVAQASLIVKLVMLTLLGASMMSWTFIFQKWKELKEARVEAQVFEDQFWSGSDLVTIYKTVEAKGNGCTGMERIFQAGFKEFARLRGQPGIDGRSVVEGSQRAMRVAMNREIDYLEGKLSFLATVGSTSPYVGLFGTVWGIMNSFRSLGAMNQATLASVAPGIAEALVATAIGLFAAIPAVIAYNRYANDAERLGSRYDIFVEEFSTILQRQAHV
ncbi:MAG: protein TolQ [Gammaproteobacteria bacterium]|nr:protein TolQ [Gammaproteobacteria bacterium]